MQQKSMSVKINVREKHISPNKHAMCRKNCDLIISTHILTKLAKTEENSTKAVRYVIIKVKKHKRLGGRG